MNGGVAISQFNRAIFAVVITFGVAPPAAAPQCNAVRGTAWWSDVASMLDQIHFPLPGIRVTSGKVSLGFY